MGKGTDEIKNQTEREDLARTTTPGYGVISDPAINPAPDSPVSSPIPEEVRRRTKEEIRDEAYAHPRAEHRDSQEILFEIERTRAKLDRTVNDIQNRLAPQQMIGQAMDSLKANLRQGSPRMIEAVKSNPLPTALVAVGVGWLVVKSMGGEPERHISQYSAALGEKAGEAADKALESAKDAAGSVREKTGRLADQARDKASELMSSAKEKSGQIAGQALEQAGHLGSMAANQAGRVRSAFAQALQDNPLAVGAFAVAIGAAIGLSLPRTRREDELMGETRDTLLEKAKETGRETMEKVQQVAGEAGQAAEKKAQEEHII